MRLENVAILSAVRTPIGKGPRGMFSATRPDELGAQTIKEAIKRANVDGEQMGDVIFGCAMPEGEQGMNVARIMSLRAGLPVTVPAATINRFCASGLHAVADVAKSIETKQIDVGVAGGVESMSMVPMSGNKPSLNPYLVSNLPDAYLSMGLTAEEVAQRFSINRKAQDEFALLSHQKACQALEKGWFKDECITVSSYRFKAGTKKDFTANTDEGPRPDTSMKALAKLKPAFRKDGSVTAGNSSQVSDGAASVVLMHKDEARKSNKKIRAMFRAFVTAGVDPAIMGVGPVPAVKKLLKVTKMSLSDIDVFELNEAFAAQSIYCIKELGLDSGKVNPLGGAIALGHPLGCTGARQIATILHHMERNNLRFGVCTMCIGGGMGAAGLIELA